MPSGPQNVLNTIGSYGVPAGGLAAKPIDSTVYQNWLNSTNNRTGQAPYTLPSYASSYQPPGWANMDPSGGVYGNAPGVGYDAAAIAAGITPTPPPGGWGNPQPLGVASGFPTSNQPGVPYLGSTSITPGAGGFSPSTPDYINLLNQLNLGAQQAANVGRIPGEAGLEAQSSGNIAQELAGQLPQDVLNLIQQQGAERGVMSGSPGSPNAEAATLAALGLTSLGLQQQGQQDLSAAAARNPAAQPINLTGMLLTPYEAGQLNLRSRESTPIVAPPAYTGPGSGQGVMPPMPGVGGPGNSWWNNLFQQPGTPSPSPFAGPTDPNAAATQYPGTNLPGFPSLADLLGPQNPYYQPAPLPTQPDQPIDTGYNPFTDQSTYDPFAQYGLSGLDFAGGGP